MNSKQVNQGLDILRTQLSTILDPVFTDRAIGRAQSEAVATEKLYRKYCGRSDHINSIVNEGWGFTIENPPLRFTKTEINGYLFAVDIICEFRWKDGVACKRSIVLRLWALDDRVWFREHWDSESIRGKFQGDGLKERVMARFHFEDQVPNASEPPYHMQVGGVARPGECCWLHPKIDVPRFPFPPMDLFLMCELVGANFYPRVYRKIRTDNTWKGQILKSQAELLQKHFEDRCKDIANSKRIFSDYLER